MLYSFNESHDVAFELVERIIYSHDYLYDTCNLVKQIQPTERATKK